MECLIFSDSHGNASAMRRALRAHPGAEVVFFLGDGIRDFEIVREEFPEKMYCAVRGNCDFSSLFHGEPLEKMGVLDVGGHRIFYTHGDLYDVKYMSDRILYAAESRGADIVLFGHTHRPFCRYCSELPTPVWLFNPGSIGARGDGNLTYGLLTLTENGVLFSHGEDNF